VNTIINLMKFHNSCFIGAGADNIICFTSRREDNIKADLTYIYIYICNLRR
jgi:hypothetical protein